MIYTHIGSYFSPYLLSERLIYHQLHLYLFDTLKVDVNQQLSITIEHISGFRSLR